MGVIRKPNVNIAKGAESGPLEENLGIPGTSSEDERSVASVELPSRFNLAHNRHRPPVPMYFPSSGKRLGKKKARHHENVTQLMTLLEEDEPNQVTIYDLIPDSCGGFTKIFRDQSALEVWDEFINSSEEAQEQILQENSMRPATKLSTSTGSGVQLTGEQAFMNIKSGIRNKLKKTHVPQGMMDYLESSLVAFFENDSTKMYLSEAISSFERLLLHAIAQYHRLISLSVSDAEDKRIVRVHYPYQDEFQVPSLLLGQFLQQRYEQSGRNI